MKSNLIILLVVSFLLFNCEENKTANVDLCNGCVVIDNNSYNATETSNYTILDVNLTGDTLAIKIGSSGCSSENWKATLIDSGNVLEPFPVVRSLKLKLENNEACLAYFEKEYTFNIKELKENYTQIILNIDGWQTQINYN